jgi:hypothetical protein
MQAFPAGEPPREDPPAFTLVAEIQALASGQTTVETWQRQCAELAIGDLPPVAPAE